MIYGICLSVYTSFSTHPRRIHVAENGAVSLFFNGWVISHCVYIFIHHLYFFIHLSVSRHLRYFRVFVMNSFLIFCFPASLVLRPEFLRTQTLAPAFLPVLSPRARARHPGPQLCHWSFSSCSLSLDAKHLPVLPCLLPLSCSTSQILPAHHSWQELPSLSYWPVLACSQVLLSDHLLFILVQPLIIHSWSVLKVYPPQRDSSSGFFKSCSWCLAHVHIIWIHHYFFLVFLSFLDLRFGLTAWIINK